MKRLEEKRVLRLQVRMGVKGKDEVCEGHELSRVLGVSRASGTELQKRLKGHR